jgi:hypothetical protein
MKSKRTSLIIASTMVLSLGSISCTSDKKPEAIIEVPVEVTEIDVIETPIMQNVWLIDEHQVSNTIPVTTAVVLAKPKTATVAVNEQKKELEFEEKIEEEEVVEEEAYEVVAVEDVYEALLGECEPVEETVLVSIVTLDKTQTIQAYKKKGKEVGEIQVISTPEGIVEQIVFTGGKHQDVYDVETGLSGKEVRKLRKEMKHIVRKGQVFLYSESSNVMYLMDDTFESADGEVDEEITSEDVDNMNVQAIIWKDKKSHKKS